jgi:hypothetical protein
MLSILLAISCLQIVVNGSGHSAVTLQFIVSIIGGRTVLEDGSQLRPCTSYLNMVFNALPNAVPKPLGPAEWVWSLWKCRLSKCEYNQWLLSSTKISGDHDSISKNHKNIFKPKIDQNYLNNLLVSSFVSHQRTVWNRCRGSKFPVAVRSSHLCPLFSRPVREEIWLWRTVL